MSPPPIANSVIECCGVNCDDNQLFEREAGCVVITVPRRDIKQLTLCDGLLAPHPNLQIMLGLLLASLAYLPIRHLIPWFRDGGIFFTIELGIIAIALIGVWLVISAFRRGLFLEAETESGVRRLQFDRHPAPSELESFLKAVERRYSLRIGKR